MKKILMLLLAAMVYVMPLSTQAAESGVPKDENYHYYMLAGAVGGALAFNFITGGVEAIPFVTSSSSLWEGPLAANRVLTAVSVALGLAAVDWAYHNLDMKKADLDAKKAGVEAPALH